MSLATWSIIFLVLNVLGHSKANCPDKWVTFHESCYMFGTHAVNHTMASDFCHQHGGYLVQVETKVENDFLREYMGELRPSDFWLGMTDEVDEGAWVWSESQTPVEFLDWNPGEPNDFPTIEEDCAAFGQKVGHHWIDVRCSTSRSPVCESKSFDSPSTAQEIVG